MRVLTFLFYHQQQRNTEGNDDDDRRTNKRGNPRPLRLPNGKLRGRRPRDMLDHTRQALADVVPPYLSRHAARRLPGSRGGRVDATRGHRLLIVRSGSGPHRREKIQGVLRRDPQAAGGEGGEGGHAVVGRCDLRVAGPRRQSLQHVLQESDDHTRCAHGRGRDEGGGIGEGRRERDRRHGTIEGHRTVDRGYMGRLGEGPGLGTDRAAGPRQGEGRDLGNLLGHISGLEAQEGIFRHRRVVFPVGGHCLGVTGTLLLLPDLVVGPKDCAESIRRHLKI